MDFNKETWEEFTAGSIGSNEQLMKLLESMRKTAEKNEKSSATLSMDWHDPEKVEPGEWVIHCEFRIEKFQPEESKVV